MKSTLIILSILFISTLFLGGVISEKCNTSLFYQIQHVHYQLQLVQNHWIVYTLNSVILPHPHVKIVVQ
ncbi:hypothetical protein DFA_02361 [Cavenderia fasciculata]|uniref:Uncharacterized protein n=1 Tax=Cavenderia fasciculata TaxID=261658 RepID=F4PZ85_CACFS|nr:uncharacterized protein DFA_02361 [Cavenderia fasciculata]EGG19114.1 hypothetical protein DFA_02361 [Cavenderia fasciculata]|eukprot:XP_004366747.1 hypothetical protein DFA_02361 [Cavenderia fasciculata]